MAKRRRVAVAPTPLKDFGRHDPVRERRNRLLVVASVTGVLIVLLVLASVGYVNSYVRPPRRTALTVGDRTFIARDLARRVRIAIADQGGPGQSGGVPDPAKILDTMRDEEVLRQSSSQLGISLEPQEVNEAVASRLGVDYGGPGSPFDVAYRAELTRTEMSDDAYREMVTADVLQERVRAFFAAALPESSDQVKLELILVGTEEEAKTVIDRINGGEEFASVAQSASRDTATASLGGARDWTPHGVLAPVLEEAAFTLKRGTLSEPIKTDEGYYVIRVTDRRRDAGLDETQRQEMIDAAYEAWLAQRREALHAEEFLDDEMSNWVLQQAVN